MANYNSIYNNVYNYYHNTYAPKSSTNSRFDAHKKSDLKNIYNSIVAHSKEEPVFLIRPSSDIEKYTITMKESAMQFQRDIASMGGQDANELFEKKAIYSSSPENAEASELPGSLINDDSSVELTIESLAKPQINKGVYLPSDDINLEPASYSFDVTTPASSYELQLNISESDTNLSIQNRLARLINNAGIGLTATVSQDNDGNSALTVSSSSTGSGNVNEPPFIISDDDTSQTRGLINYLGIKDISQEASWAKYTIDGEKHTSPDNEITAAGKFQITLKKETSPNDSPITIGTMADFDSLKENILGVAGSYNRFIRTAAEFLDKQPRTSVLIDNMKRMNSHYASTMDRLGISRNSDGTLDIDEEKLTSSLSGNATASDISTLRDFTKSATKKIADIQLNPMDYVDKRIVAYKNPHIKHFANPYITSAYSGMLFNSYM